MMNNNIRNWALGLVLAMSSSLTMAQEHQHDMTENDMAAESAIMIHNAWIRAAAPGQSATAGFMQIMNHSNEAQQVVGVQADFAKASELHKTAVLDGVMTMKLQPSVNIAAQQSTEFKPGGLHVMFIGLTQTIAEGDRLEFTLTFADGAQQRVVAKVLLDPNAMPKTHHHH